MIIADDAFQHRRLERDLDIVLVDALNPWGHGALLPRGLLREPRSALRRAHVVVLTRADLVAESDRAEIWQIVKENNPTVATVELSFTPDGLVDKAGARSMVAALNDSSNATTDSKAGSGVLAFCGIGNPDGFQKTLAAAGITVCELVTFPDHHHYDRADLQKLTAIAEKLAATALVTTVKDLVKIDAEWIGSVPLFALNIKAEVTSGENALAEAISQATQPKIP